MQEIILGAIKPKIEIYVISRNLQEMIKDMIAIILLTTLGISAYAQQNISDSLQHQNLERKYIVHLPPDYNSSISEPAVIVLHGGSGNYQSVQGFTQMNLVSNQNRFLAIYPQGIGSAPPGFSWADGRNTTADQAGIDDIGFISKLIDSLFIDYNIDTNRVYICGYSNGGFMTQLLACEVPERFAAIGGLGCSMDTSLFQSCNPNQAVPMAYFSGTADPEVPFNGGVMNNPSVTPIVPVDTAVQFWVENNNCQTPEPVVNLPDIDPSDSSTIELYKFTECNCDADFYYYKILNGGHTWPGVPISQFPQLGNTNEDIHASFELWDFFSRFSLCGNVTGIGEQVSASVISVYPNPTSDILYVKTNIEIESITVYDFMGRSLSREGRKEINLSQQLSGIYFLVIVNKDKTTRTMKVIKK